MRIAILVCSTDSSGFSEQYPNDGEKFVTLLQPIRPDWSFHAVPVNENVLPGLVSDHDGYIVTGSPKSNQESDDWVERLHAFIRKLDEARAPTVGICFGHQAIAAALGGRLQENPGDTTAESFNIGVETLHLVSEEPWMKPPRDALSLYAAHAEQVTRLPKSARLIGWSHDCPVASFVVGERGREHMLACEFHPEIYRDFIRAMIVSKESDLGSDVVAAKLEEIETETDGAVMGEWMARFLEMER